MASEFAYEKLQEEVGRFLVALGHEPSIRYWEALPAYLAVTGELLFPMVPSPKERLAMAWEAFDQGLRGWGRWLPCGLAAELWSVTPYSARSQLLAALRRGSRLAWGATPKDHLRLVLGGPRGVIAPPDQWRPIWRLRYRVDASQGAKGPVDDLARVTEAAAQRWSRRRTELARQFHLYEGAKVWVDATLPLPGSAPVGPVPPPRPPRAPAPVPAEGEFAVLEPAEAGENAADGPARPLEAAAWLKKHVGTPHVLTFGLGAAERGDLEGLEVAIDALADRKIMKAQRARQRLIALRDALLRRLGGC